MDFSNNRIDTQRRTAVYVRISTSMKVYRGEYQQLLFSEFSRLDRKPSNLLRTLETLQKKNVYCWFNKQGIWVKDKNDIGTQIMIQVLASSAHAPAASAADWFPQGTFKGGVETSAESHRQN